MSTRHNVVVVAEGGWNGDVQHKNYRPLIEAEEKGEISLTIYHFLYCYFSLSFWRATIRADIIVFGMGPLHPLVVPVWILMISGKKVVNYTSWPYWTTREWAYSTPLDSVVYLVWKRAVQGSETVAVTETAMDSIEKFGGTAHHIPHAVDTEVFSPDRAETDPKSVLFAGILEPRKGVMSVLELAERLPEDVTVRVAGDGELADEVRRHDSIEYLGYLATEELAREYSQAGVFLAPSRPVDGWTELFGVVLIEALASGTPVVTTDCPGPREIITSNVGRVIPNGAEDFDDRLLDCTLEILNDPDLRRSMAKMGRCLAITTYSQEVTADQWVELLSEITDKQSRGADSSGADLG